MYEEGTALQYSFTSYFTQVWHGNFTTGIHFEQDGRAIDPFTGEEYPRRQRTFLPVIIGIERVLFQDSMAGSFRPILFAEAGEVGDFSGKRFWDREIVWTPMFAAGAGVQFTAGSTRNRMTIGRLSSRQLEGNIVMELTIYWK